MCPNLKRLKKHSGLCSCAKYANSNLIKDDFFVVLDYTPFR